jgi:hypothetical protein
MQKSGIQVTEADFRPGCTIMVRAFGVINCEMMAESVQVLKQIKDYCKESTYIFYHKDRVGQCTGNY